MAVAVHSIVVAIRRTIPERRPPAHVASNGQDISSYCLTCAHWHFNSRIERCSRCGSMIFRWITDADMRFMRSRSVLGKM